MKKLFLSFVFVALSAMTFAQQWNDLGKSNPAGPEVKLVSSSEQQIVVDFALGGFNLTEVNTPKGIQHVVSVPKMVAMLEAGAPDLPQFPIPAIIGDMAEMTISIMKSDYVDYENVEIAPSKGNFSRQINPDDVPYTYGKMYGKNAFYPMTQAHLEAPYVLRDFRGQNFMVTPFAYNPATKTLRVYHHMTIAMKKVSDNGENPKVARSSKSVKTAPEFKAAYDHRFINFQQTSKAYPWLEEQGEMVVICADQFMESMQPFVDWKNQSGRPTTMVSVTEAGGNNTDAIKDYINNIYNDPNRNLVYVLFVGDYQHITPHPFSYDYKTEYSDIWFGMLEGTDYYPEVFVGRFSVQTEEHVATHISKVLYYERDMQSDVTWTNHGLGLGSTREGSGGHYGEYDNVHIDYIRDTLLHYTYTEVTDLHTGGSGSSNATSLAVSNVINEGVSIINYCNHGSETSWAVANYSNSHVNALTNDNMLPIVWSVACLNGKFNHNTDCFAEAWLRATDNSTGVPTGAIGGMFSWISQPWAPPMYGQDEMVNILTGWSHADQFNHTLAGASLNGAMGVLDFGSSDAFKATQHSWLLFGDPTLMVRTDIPAEMNASVNPPVLLIGMNELEVSVSDTDYGIAALSMDGEVLASGNIQNGICNLNFNPLNAVGTATLIVMGYNKVTEVIEVQVNPAEGPFITVNACDPGFAPVNQETSLNMTFKNVGVDPTASTTTVTLTCADDRLEILNGSAEFDVLPANETITLNDAFSFIIAEGVEDATRFQLDITMTCGSETWTGKSYVVANQAVLNYTGITWSGSFVPGETLTLAANFQNTGHYMATNAIATIACQNEYATLLNETFEIGTLDPNGTAVCSFDIAIAENCPESEQIPLTFTLTADGGLTAEGSAALKNSCIVIFELIDSYGDGWNNNMLTVAFDDGTPSMQLTIDDGYSETYTIEIGNGVNVTLGWVTGYYSNECSFNVKYENGEAIYSGNANVNYSFVCICGSTSGGTTYDVVDNLNAEVGTEAVTLTWDIPEGALTFTIIRNGVEVGTTEDNTFTDELSNEGSYTYCVVANYETGSSLPVCTVIEAEWGIGESETNFSIYPNPVSNSLYINGGNAQYSYELFNGMGQKVAYGNGQGTVQISVNDLTKGVYFLRLTSGSQVIMEKVVVE